MSGRDDRPLILAINAGSSSLKATYHDMARAGQSVLSIQIERIGGPGSRMQIVGNDGALLLDRTADLATHDAAARAFFAWVRREQPAIAPRAIGHRVVHGGRAHRAPHLLTADLQADLERLISLDPDHLPQALAVMKVVSAVHPAVPQAVCFDTSFHRSMPRAAQIYPLPARFAETGVLRYGFHGLSCEFIVQALEAIDARQARGRLIIAHLGHGASLTAVRDGRSLDTTMGFTPSGGIMMGTRPGDLDPGVLVHLLDAEGMSAAALNRLVTREAGLLGVSGVSGDMRDLLERESGDPYAADAVALFCYLARKAAGGLAAVLGGLDTLVFTAGIGEHAAPVRARICRGLEMLGIELDEERNDGHAPVISRDGSRVVVRVMKTDEGLMIARHVWRLLTGA
ncbi:MAG: acetate/propionate family kinase [Acidobacteria bacterium]|nr:acetate/propionate family kinase [Acidobacteriota bacterium]